MVVHSPSKPTTTPWPALLPMGALAGKPPVPIARPATLVGSRQTANLRLHSSTVSKAHALILSGDSKVHIRDLNSRTKVFVNGKEVREADLREGDQVKIGRFTFRFTAGPKIQSNARRRTAPTAQLQTDDGDAVALTKRVTVIGQRAGCDLVLPNPAVSTTHAAIYDVNGRRYIMDLGSRSGTLVNNQKTLQVELRVGDVIDIGGTDVRYVAAAGAAAPAPVAPVSRSKASAPAPAATQEESDLDELLALDSLNEAPAPSKPSSQSKIFEPPSTVPDDSNVPIPLEEDEGVKLPEPTPEPEAEVELALEALSEPEIEAPPHIDEAKLFEPPSSVPDDTNAPIAVETAEPEVEEVEQEPQPAPAAEVEPLSSALQEQSDIIPVEIDDQAPSAEPQETVVAAENTASAKAAEDELLALLDETLEAESQQELSVPQEQEVPAPIAEEPEAIAEEEPLAIEEEVAPLPVQEEPIVIEQEAAPVPVSEVEESLPLEIEEELQLEPAPTPTAEDEGEVVGTATANVDVIPQPPEEIADEVEEAVPDDQLPAVEQELAEDAVTEEMPLVVEESLPSPQPHPETPEPAIDQLDELLEDEPQAQAPEAAPEPIAAAPAEPQPAPPPPPVQEAKEFFQEPPKLAPGAPKPRWIAAPSTQQFTPTVLNIQRPRPPVDFDLDDLLEQKKSTPFATRAAPIINDASPPTPAPPAPPTPQPLEVAPPVIEERLPEPQPLDLAETPEPPLPVEETPDSDDLALAALEELAPPEPEALQPRPVEVEPEPLPLFEEASASPAIETNEDDDLALDALEELSPPEPQAIQQPPEPIEPEPLVEEAPAPPAAQGADEDELALEALEELTPPAPQPEAAQAVEVEPVEPPALPEPIEETVAEPEPPQPALATTSTEIVPEAPPAITATADIAAAEDDAADLLEDLPEDESAITASPLADQEKSPILSFAAAAPAPQAETQPESIEEPAAPDVFSLGQRRPASAAPTRTPHHRGVGSPGRIPPRPRSAAPIPPRWGPLASATAADIVPAASPRRARKKLSILLVLMLVAMVLAALAVWKFVLPRVLVQGTIRFDNAGNLRGDALNSFQKNQLDLLADAKVRATAEGLFKAKPGRPAAAGFFVDQDFRPPQLQSKWQTNGDRAELLITYQGADPTLDPDRLSCVLQAIYEANRSNVSTAAAAEKTLDQKRMTVSAARAELTKIRERRVVLESIVRPDAFELAATQAAVDKLDQAWTDALAARKAIAADIDRLQQPADATASGKNSDGDSALKLMSEKLAALNGRVAEAKSTAAREASDARKSLNATIEQFQSSIGVAQGMMKDNPALNSYISSAQKLHEASWKLQGDLIERQERQQKQLLEYKKRLEEQVELRKREMLEKDPDLKELNHLLEMKRREFNTLSATGALKRDVEKLRGDISTLEGRILARTVAVSEDKFYKDAIAGLKQIIDSVQGQLDMDRAASEKLMNDLETKFRNTSPEIETLPAAQRNLAARLTEQVNAMQAARKHYSEAVVSQDADANDRLKDLQAAAAQLEGEIALRRKELAAEQDKKLTEQQSEELKKKQGTLAEADKAERTARDAYRQKIKELDRLVERDRAYQSTREELQRIVQADEPLKQDQLNAAERSVSVAQRAAASAIAPQQPIPPKILEMQDSRFLFGIGAVLVVGLLFGSLIFFTTHSDPRQRHSSAEEKPVSA